MLKDWHPYIAIKREGNSIGGDHFRHVYSFIECLHQSVVDNKGTVNYDERKRFDITTDTYPEYAQHIGKIIFDIQQKLSQAILVKSLVYPDLLALSSVKRELQILLEHDEMHHTYFDSTRHKNDTLVSIYSIGNNITDVVLGENQSIIAHIEESILSYNTVANHIPLSDSIKNAFHELIGTYSIITKFPLDHILVKDTDSDNTNTSVSRELYYIEEALMHFLYDLRIYLKDHHIAYYDKLISTEPDFGIAHSTRRHTLSQSL